jgi:DNA-binding protein HU-beta
MKVSQADFIIQVAKRSDHGRATVIEILSDIQAQITDNLKAGNSTALVSLGSIEPSHREARMGRNMHTGESIQIKASNSAKLKVGKTLKDALN